MNPVTVWDSYMFSLWIIQRLLCVCCVVPQQAMRIGLPSTETLQGGQLKALLVVSNWWKLSPNTPHICLYAHVFDAFWECSCDTSFLLCFCLSRRCSWVCLCSSCWGLWVWGHFPWHLRHTVRAHTLLRLSHVLMTQWLKSWPGDVQQFWQMLK